MAIPLPDRPYQDMNITYLTDHYYHDWYVVTDEDVRSLGDDISSIVEVADWIQIRAVHDSPTEATIYIESVVTPPDDHDIYRTATYVTIQPYDDIDFFTDGRRHLL